MGMFDFNKRCRCGGFPVIKGGGVYCVGCNRFYGLKKELIESRHQKRGRGFERIQKAISMLKNGKKININTLKAIL